VGFIMKLSSLLNPVVAIVALASVVGCAVPTGDAPAPAESVATTSSAITLPEGVSMTSGIFGIVNGSFTAYTTIDNLVKYGNTTPSAQILDQLKKANESLASLQQTQNEQFQQLKIDVVMGTLNDLDSKIGRAWGELESSSDRTTFVPSTLTWDDFDALSNRLASMNGTSDAFTLIKQSMLTTTGPIADDPLGSYALRMRTRMAQTAYLMTRSAPITQSQQQAYDAAVVRFENSFAKATREYFVTKISPVMGAGSVGECTPAFWRWDGFYYTTPEGSNGGWNSREACEADAPNWSAGTIANARNSVVNTVWSQNDAVSTGKWKQRPGTITVVSSSVTTETNDVTKALSLMCNGVENCSLPAATVIPRLGTDARLKDEARVAVQYRCGGESYDRTASFAAGADVVLTCNIGSAVAGVYVNTAHDASPGRGPEDTVFMAINGYQPSTSPLLKSWTWTPANATEPEAAFTNDMSFWNSLQWSRTDGVSVAVQWGEEGHPTRIQSLNGSWFDWTAPAVETLPVVPQP
jgi:hypothetical protein